MRKRQVGRLNLLSARQVQTAGNGKHSDGGKLYLEVKRGKASWVFRYVGPSGRRREMGLGVCYRDNMNVIGSSMEAARRAASEARQVLQSGKDPIDERAAEEGLKRAADLTRRAERKRNETTLARAARSYHERAIEPARSSKHAAQWISSLEAHIPDRLWNGPIADVTGPMLLDAMLPLQRSIPETASRIRQRLEAVFDDADFRGLRTGNPARDIRRKLREHAAKRERGSFSALPYLEAPQFMQQLRAKEGVAARALEFAVLTAARTNEVIGCVPAEFDLDGGRWIVPKERTKGGEEHVVHLSERAVAIVKEMLGLAGTYVFPNTRNLKRQLSNMAMLTLLRRMDADKLTTVHGLCRSTFSTWANDTGTARPDVIEACLAHQEQNRVRAAYNRAEFAAERQALLRAWASFLSGEVPEAANEDTVIKESAPGSSETKLQRRAA